MSSSFYHQSKGNSGIQANFFPKVNHSLFENFLDMMNKNNKQKVVVVGAGPVGALAALYAARRGDDVEIYELRGGRSILFFSRQESSVYARLISYSDQGQVLALMVVGPDWFAMSFGFTLSEHD